MKSGKIIRFFSVNAPLDVSICFPRTKLETFLLALAQSTYYRFLQ